MDGRRSHYALASLAAIVLALDAPARTSANEATPDYFAQAPASSGGDMSSAITQPTPPPPRPNPPSTSQPRRSPSTDSQSSQSPSASQPATSNQRPAQNDLAMANPYAGLFVNPADRPSYSLASTPNMLGDVLGVKYLVRGAGGLALAAGDRGAKVADDSRPLPTDRVFFDYNHFDQANITANGAVIGLNRYTIGVEKTFFDCLCSVEIKAPIDQGLNRIQTADATTSDNEGTVFGNLSVTPKVLLFENCDWAVAAGLLLDLPTSPDAVYQRQGTVETVVQDTSVHIQPFVGVQYAPNDRLFSITYLEIDTDAGGNRVVDVIGGAPAGSLRAPTLLYVDWSAGYWLFHNDCCDCGGRAGGWLTGVAPVIELHYATALEDARTVDGVAPFRDRLDILNLTAGAHFQFGRCSTLAVACAVPLRTNPRDKEFSTELLVELNRRF